MTDLFDERIALARRLAEERQFADAITLFNWLCETYPDRAAAFVDSADTFARVYDYAGVQMRFAQIEARAQVPAAVWQAMAGISERLRRPQWAKHFMDRAVGVPSPSAEACGLFSLFLEHANDLTRAAELYERGLGIDPGNGSCQLARIRILRRHKAYDAAISAVHDLLRAPHTATEFKISAGHELAHLNDAVGDYAGAIAALTEAKRLRSVQPEAASFWQRSKLAEKTHHRFLTSLTPGYFKSAGEWEPESPQRLALLAGHPRSGTTLLEQILDSHTEMISAEETFLFGNGVNDPFLRDLPESNISDAALRVPLDKIETMRGMYFSTMEKILDQPLAGRMLVDKNPSYTDCIPVFARVFPEAFFLIALRDPRDVVLSCFFQDFPLNPVTVNFLSLHDTAMRYANSMAMWLVCRENMDERRWAEVRYESIVTNVVAESKHVMQRLGLDWQPSQAHPEKNAATRTVQSPSYAGVSQPVNNHAVGRWKRYSNWIDETMPALQTFVEAFEYQ